MRYLGLLEHLLDVSELLLPGVGPVGLHELPPAGEVTEAEHSAGLEEPHNVAGNELEVVRVPLPV